MEAKALVDTLRDRIAEKFETFCNTLGVVEPEVLVNKVARRIAVMRVKTLGDNLTEVYAEAMVDTLAERLAHLEMETLGLDSY